MAVLDRFHCIPFCGFCVLNSWMLEQWCCNCRWNIRGVCNFVCVMCPLWYTPHMYKVWTWYLCACWVHACKFTILDGHHRVHWCRVCWRGCCRERHFCNPGQLWQWLANAVHHQLHDGVGVHWWTRGRVSCVSDCVGAAAKLCSDCHPLRHLWTLLWTQCYCSTW